MPKSIILLKRLYLKQIVLSETLRNGWIDAKLNHHEKNLLFYKIGWIG
jgi:hypothetical protein